MLVNAQTEKASEAHITNQLRVAEDRASGEELSSRL